MGKLFRNFAAKINIIPNSDAQKNAWSLTVDDMLKFDKQVANICRELSQQGAILKRMRNILPFDIRKNIYVPFIVPHFDYCAQTCISVIRVRLKN